MSVLLWLSVASARGTSCSVLVVFSLLFSIELFRGKKQAQCRDSSEVVERDSSSKSSSRKWNPAYVLIPKTQYRALVMSQIVCSEVSMHCLI